jgi:arylsulfatase A-like enzyme
MTRVLFPRDQTGIPDSEIILAQALKRQGYKTAIIGKWHLGHLPQFLPTRHGFDYYYGIPYSHDMGAPVDGRRDCPLMRGEEIIERPAIAETLTERYTGETIEYIRANKNKPFFIYLPHNMPHKPWTVSERFKGKSKGGVYGDMVECIDWGVGEIVKALKELGLDKKTLVMFTSDNGPNGGSAGILRGMKGQVFEGGMREPLVASWPGTIRPGTVCRQPASMLDLFTTVIRLAGGAPPKDRPIDGRDIARLFTVPGASLPDYPFYYFRTDALQAIRVGAWKLHLGRGGEALAEPELYNLGLDVRESRDVAKDHPEVVADLKKRAEKFVKGLPNGAHIGGSAESY